MSDCDTPGTPNAVRRFSTQAGMHHHLDDWTTDGIAPATASNLGIRAPSSAYSLDGNLTKLRHSPRRYHGEDYFYKDGGLPRAFQVSEATAEGLEAGGNVVKTRTELLAETRQLWRERHGRPVTDEEAQEIIDNMGAYAKVIIDWYLEEQRRDDGSVNPSDAR